MKFIFLCCYYRIPVLKILFSLYPILILQMHEQWNLLSLLNRSVTLVWDIVSVVTIHCDA